jgi:hypothetical protein
VQSSVARVEMGDPLLRQLLGSWMKLGSSLWKNSFSSFVTHMLVTNTTCSARRVLSF